MAYKPAASRESCAAERRDHVQGPSTGIVFADAPGNRGESGDTRESQNSFSFLECGWIIGVYSSRS